MIFFVVLGLVALSAGDPEIKPKIQPEYNEQVPPQQPIPIPQGQHPVIEDANVIPFYKQVYNPYFYKMYGGYPPIRNYYNYGQKYDDFYPYNYRNYFSSPYSNEFLAAYFSKFQPKVSYDSRDVYDYQEYDGQDFEYPSARIPYFMNQYYQKYAADDVKSQFVPPYSPAYQAYPQFYKYFNQMHPYTGQYYAKNYDHYTPYMYKNYWKYFDQMYYPYINKFYGKNQDQFYQQYPYFSKEYEQFHHGYPLFNKYNFEGDYNQQYPYWDKAFEQTYQKYPLFNKYYGRNFYGEYTQQYPYWDKAYEQTYQGYPRFEKNLDLTHDEYPSIIKYDMKDQMNIPKVIENEARDLGILKINQIRKDVLPIIEGIH